MRLFPLATAFLLPIAVHAQGPAERRPDIAVLPVTRDSIVHQVATLVRRYYADSSAGDKMATAIERRQRERAYVSFDSAAGLVGALNAHLNAVHADAHLRLDYFVVPRPMRAPVGTAAEEDLDARRRVAMRRGAGVERVERLQGNVAVIALRSFEPPSIGGVALGAAMQLANGADAIILDLRQNGGGYGDMVSELASYFLPPGTVLSEMYDRPTGRTERAIVPNRPSQPAFASVPLFILTSRRTFSAAEGFAYAMRARGRATVVGDTTRGGEPDAGLPTVTAVRTLPPDRASDRHDNAHKLGGDGCDSGRTGARGRGTHRCLPSRTRAPARSQSDSRRCGGDQGRPVTCSSCEATDLGVPVKA